MKAARPCIGKHDGWFLTTDTLKILTTNNTPVKGVAFSDSGREGGRGGREGKERRRKMGRVRKGCDKRSLRGGKNERREGKTKWREERKGRREEMREGRGVGIKGERQMKGGREEGLG